jgi:imidazolonepropionase-like amidohydrolase
MVLQSDMLSGGKDLMKKNLQYSISLVTALALVASWLPISAFPATGDGSASTKAFVGARIIDGTGKAPLENATLIVRNGRIEAVGTSVKLPAGAQRIDATGKTIIPGLASGHSHIFTANQLERYARYGITTVMSLGGDNEIAIRDQLRSEHPAGYAHLFIAGPIVVSKTPEDARKAVDLVAAAKTDIVKFRLDDQLGKATKMSPEVYTAIFDEAHKKGMRVAVHVVVLSDAKAVLKLGANMIAHSVRDQDIDDETIALLKKNHAVYCPTFTRELSTYVYGEKPAFLNDSFLLNNVDRAELAKVQDPAFQEKMRNDQGGQWYKEHLPIAMRNMKKVFDAGVPVVMGTDTGAPTGRFQGYFEHVELEYMVNAGLNPMQTLVASTSNVAKFLHASDLGTLEPGKSADLVVLNANPLDDIKNTRKIDSVYIAGNRVSDK